MTGLDWSKRKQSTNYCSNLTPCVYQRPRQPLTTVRISNQLKCVSFPNPVEISLVVLVRLSVDKDKGDDTKTEHESEEGSGDRIEGRRSLELAITISISNPEIRIRIFDRMTDHDHGYD